MENYVKYHLKCGTIIAKTGVHMRKDLELRPKICI